MWEKNPEIRVCADFSTGLNVTPKDFNNPLPCPEDIFAKLNGGNFFSKIDFSDAYLQIPIEEMSSKLLCINKHHGLYKLERLPFGVRVAPTIFSRWWILWLWLRSWLFRWHSDEKQNHNWTQGTRPQSFY